MLPYSILMIIYQSLVQTQDPALDDFHRKLTSDRQITENRL